MSYFKSLNTFNYFCSQYSKIQYNHFQLTKRFSQLSKKYLPNILQLDFSNVEDLKTLENNAKFRKTAANINKVKQILSELENDSLNENQRIELSQQLENELWTFPNRTHPNCLTYGDEPKELEKFNELPPTTNKNVWSFSDIGKKLNIFRIDHLGNFTGHKSYYFMDLLAEMENALIQYTVNHLKKENFNLISVPDVLPANIIEGCGMKASGERNQVYKLKSSRKCLSGTSEMALAGYFKDKILNEDELPIKVASVSRCFRAETSGLQEEKGIYRVHQFTKVEMFSICTEEQSEQLLELFKDTEIEIFKKLGIHFKLLDMPACELGAPAYRKYDIEAWMPGRKMWGEISSCSNCTDYQARRLNIRYKNNYGELKFAHTVNGTACAIPRMLITLIESYQNENGTLSIPKVLQSYLDGRETISRKKILPELKLVKHIDAAQC